MTERSKKSVSSSDSNPLPKHHRVYLVLRQQIQERLYSSEQALPSEMLLAEQFQVSRITIRKAMERLDREGLVVRQRGKGTFPLDKEESSPVQASISGSIENLIAMGLKTEVRVQRLYYMEASVEVSEALKIPVGSSVQKAVRVRSLRGSPFAVLTTYVPDDIGRTFSREDLTAKPLLVLLERAGINVERAEQNITAKLASPETAQLLEMEPGDAVLSIRRVVFDDTGRPVEYIQGLYRPDAYEHQMSVERHTQDSKRIWKH